MFNRNAETAFRAALNALYQQIEAAKPLFWMPIHMGLEASYRISTVNTRPNLLNRRRVCVIVLDQSGLTIYPQSAQMDQKLHFPQSVWRWFGRPEKYKWGKNRLLLHVEVDKTWQIIELRLEQYYMQQLIRACKTIATPEQKKAYRRHRPYIHYGPTTAFAADQDVHGVWTISPEARQLYLMPYALVIFDGAQVNRVIPLEQMQEIEAVRRLDQPGADGLVRFKIVHGESSETCAYTLPDFTAFGAALAEAAKDPLIFNQKKKDHTYDEDA